MQLGDEEVYVAALLLEVSLHVCNTAIYSHTTIYYILCVKDLGM